MKKAFQIVFLIDLDGVSVVPSETGGSEERITECTHTLRRICLRFLTYFAAQQCVSNGQTSIPSTLVKWGYKLYHSRSKKTVHQRYHFKDLELEALEQFETDLECQLRKFATTETVNNGSEAIALQQAIRELVCDFPWDSPYISSPVKRPRNCPNSRLQSGTEGSDSSSSSSTVDNYSILVTRVPSSTQEFESFFGQSCPTVKQILERIVPMNVRRQMCDVAKIRLLWLDAYPFYPPDTHQDVKRDATLNTFELFHQTLTTIGGGLIPLGSVLLHETLRDDFGQNGPSCHRFHFPESYRLRIPFASIVSLYLNYAEIPNSSSFYLNATLDLPSNGTNSSAHHAVELLPLFKKISCHHCLASDSESSLKNVEETSSECDCEWNPRSLRPLGTMKLADIQKNFSADSKVYICCPRRTMNQRQTSNFEDLLDNLTDNYNALVVSCDALRLGFLVPANDDSCVSILYLLSETSGTECADTVWKLMDAWEVPVRKGLSGLLRNSNSPFFLKNWLLNCDNICKKKSDRGEEELLSKLQRSREPPPSAFESEYSRCSPRNSKRHFRSVSQRGSKMISKSIQFNRTQNDVKHSQQIKGGRETMFGSKSNRERRFCDVEKSVEAKDLSSEERLLSDVNATYDRTIHNGEKIIEGAQEIVLTIKEYHRNNCSKDEDVDKRSVTYLTENVLMNSKNLSSKHAKLKNVTKNVRIQECYLQIMLRLEMQVLFTNGIQFVDEVTSLLRSVSFVAGPSVLSSFLRETVVENYYPFLKDTVTEICEELNQPLPSDSRDDSLSPTPSLSSLGSFSSDINEPTSNSIFSQLSTTSSLSSCNTEPIANRNKRSELIRHPSFADVTRKRQIAVPFVKTRKDSIAPAKNAVARSAVEKNARLKHTEVRRSLFDDDDSELGRKHVRSHTTIGGFAATSKHYTPRKHEKPTTPKGHHVLRTKKVADTPIHKQVANVVLTKQRNLRKKFRSEAEENDDLIVDESPDKHNDELPFRRSPRRHASSLERQASFYSSDSQSRNLAKAESQMQAETTNELVVSYDDRETASFLLSEITQSPWSKKTPKQDRAAATKDNSSSAVMFATPRSKSRVRRNLNLGDGGLKSPCGNEANGRTEEREETSIKKRKLASLFDDDAAAVAPRRSQRFKSSEDSCDELQVLQNGRRTSSKSSRSQDIVSSSDVLSSINTVTSDVEQSVVPVANGVVEVVESSDSQTEGIIISTPSRNGIDSPTECQPTECMPLIHGPLAANLDDYLSRSSSPRIPLLVSEMGIRFDDYMSDYEPLYVDYDDEIWSDCSKSDSPFTSDVVSQNEEVFKKNNIDESGLNAVPFVTNGLKEPPLDGVVPSCETAFDKQGILLDDDDDDGVAVTGSKSSLDIPNHIEPCSEIAGCSGDDDAKLDETGDANSLLKEVVSPLLEAVSSPKANVLSSSKDDLKLIPSSSSIQSSVHLTMSSILASVSENGN